MAEGVAQNFAVEQIRLTPESFAARLRESHRTVWTIAAAILNDSTLAEDMVQEAAAIALTKLDEFDPSTSFSAWFGQIVRFVSLNEGRKRRRARGPSIDAVAEPVGHPGPTAPHSADERVRAAVESLAEIPRLCLLLRTVHAMSFSEIAKALGIPEGTAMSHVHRARAILRERIADELGGAQ